MSDNYIKSTGKKDRSAMIKDGWVLTKEGNSEMIKWVLQNPKYNYRSFYYNAPINNGYNRRYEEMGKVELLKKLCIDVEMGKLELPYPVSAKGIK